MFSLLTFIFLCILIATSSPFRVVHRRKASTRQQFSLDHARSVSFLATSRLTSTLMTPIGDVGLAVDAIFRSGGQAATCVLDGKKADDFHDSCQLLDYVVRVRANHLLTFHQSWGTSKSTGAAIWSNMTCLNFL